MKNTIATCMMGIVLSLALGVGTTTTSAAVGTDQPAPNFTLKDTQGKKHSLSDFKGKFVVLEWTNAQCPFVKKFYDGGKMQAWQKQMSEDGAVWLQIVSSAEGKQGYVTPQEGETLRQEKGMKSTAMLLDPEGKVGKMYGAATTPHVYLINPEGVLVYQGAIDSIRSVSADDIPKADNYLKTAYAESKDGKKVSKASTTPYGCAIKYK